MTPNIIAIIITTLTSGGALAALVAWLRERNKDKATTDLTNAQTQQAKLAYLIQVAEFQQKHIKNLQQDYDDSEERNRKMKQRMIGLEEELDRVRRSAADTQAKCEALSIQLKTLVGES